MGQRQFLVNFFALLMARGGGLIISILVGLFLVRALSNSAFGAYSLATTTIGLMGVVADFGFDPIISREIAANRGRNTLVRWVGFLRGGLALLLTIVGCLLAQVTPILGRADLLLIGGVGLVPRGLMRTIAAVLIGRGLANRAAQLEGITTAASSCLAFLFVILAEVYQFSGERAAVVGLSLGSLIGAVFSLRHWETLKSLPEGPTAWRVYLRGAATFTLIGLVGVLFQAMDVYLVAAWYRLPTNAVDNVALYAAPFRVLNLLLVLPTVWGTIALPRYSQLALQPAAMIRQLRQDVLRWLVIGGLVCGGCTIFAEPITTLALGPSYQPSVPLLQILCWMVLFASLSAPAVAYLTAVNQQRLILMSVLVGILILVVINLVLFGTGLAGVAAAKVLSMALMAGAYWLAIRRHKTW